MPRHIWDVEIHAGSSPVYPTDKSRTAVGSPWACVRFCKRRVFDSSTRWFPQRGDVQMRRVYAQLPCVIVTYIPGKDLVAAKIGISRKGCSKRPICTQPRGPLMYKSSALRQRESRRAAPQVTLMWQEDIKLYSGDLATKEVVQLPVVEL